jgi:hypothetical protein
MLQLDIPATEDTPKIVYTGETNEFNISGRSLPEDVTTFYRPVFEWLEQFANESKENTAFKFKLEYFNTASSKIILDILMQLEDIIESKQKNLKVEWYYFETDDDMQEAGEEYKELVNIPFDLIAY